MLLRLFCIKRWNPPHGERALMPKRRFRRTGLKVAAAASVFQVAALGIAMGALWPEDHPPDERAAQRQLLTPAWLITNNRLNLESVNDPRILRGIVGNESYDAMIIREDGEILFSTKPAFREQSISLVTPDWNLKQVDAPRLTRREVGDKEILTAIVPFRYEGYFDPYMEHDQEVMPILRVPSAIDAYIISTMEVILPHKAQRKALLYLAAGTAICMAITTFLLWVAVELLLLRRVRAAAQYAVNAAPIRADPALAIGTGDEISDIEQTLRRLISAQNREMKRRSAAEASLETAEIRAASSIAAAQSEVRQVRSLIEAMQSGMLTMDNAGWVSSCDDFAARRLGEQPEAIVGQPLRAFLRRETSASDAGVFSLAALNDWPPETHRCRVVSPAGDGDTVEIVVSDAEAQNGRRVVLIRDAGDDALRQEIGDLAEAIEQTMGPSAHSLGSLRERLAVLREYVAGLESDKQLVSTALDRVPVAMAVVDKLGNIRHLNRAARAIIEAKDGVSAIRGRLVAARREEQSKLQQRLSALLEKPRDKETGWAALQVEREAGTPWLILLTPLSGMASTRITSAGPADLAIVMITDPLQPVRASATVLQQLHGLTPAESEVLGRLTDGMRLSDIAEDLGVGIETVRTQLKSIFGKTGTSRQAELVRYALLGGAWIHGTELAPALIDRDRNDRTQRLENR